jgi:hypothetical protein
MFRPPTHHDDHDTVTVEYGNCYNSDITHAVIEVLVLCLTTRGPLPFSGSSQLYAAPPPESKIPQRQRWFFSGRGFHFVFEVENLPQNGHRLPFQCEIRLRPPLQRLFRQGD